MRATWLAYRACWGKILGLRVHSCGFLLPRGRLTIEGGSHISIGSLTCGNNILLSAVVSYGKDRFRPKLTLGTDVRMTDDVRIQCTNQVLIGNHVLLGSNILITDHDHGIYGGVSIHSNPEEEPGKRRLTTDGFITIEDYVHIGSYVVVTKNVKIGRGSVIAAQSLVNCDIPQYTIAAGIPARPVKRFDPQSQRWERIAATE
jgi:lipopolysaccharide O-acetyltransferase